MLQNTHLLQGYVLLLARRRHAGAQRSQSNLSKLTCYHVADQYTPTGVDGAPHHSHRRRQGDGSRESAECNLEFDSQRRQRPRYVHAREQADGVHHNGRVPRQGSGSGDCAGGSSEHVPRQPQQERYVQSRGASGGVPHKGHRRRQGHGSRTGTEGNSELDTTPTTGSYKKEKTHPL